jgi:hypothetical protein
MLIKQQHSFLNLTDCLLSDSAADCPRGVQIPKLPYVELPDLDPNVKAPSKVSN